MITVETFVRAPIGKVWEFWNEPEHIKHWYAASDDWHTPGAENNLKVGGKFSYRMEAKDGSYGFDYWGTYDAIKTGESIKATLGDGRKLEVHFYDELLWIRVVESFDPESENSLELQRTGWQAILDHFKRYVENSGEK